LAVCKHRSAENSKRKWAVRYAISTATQSNRCISVRKRQKINTKNPFSSERQQSYKIFTTVARITTI